MTKKTKKATKKAKQGKKVGTPMYVIREQSGEVNYTTDHLNEIDLENDQDEIVVEVYGFLRMGKVSRKTTLE